MWGQLITALACTLEILAEDCVIPSDSQFSRASYRPFYGRTASGKTFYNSGERLRDGIFIRVVCNKDRQGDAVLNISKHLCSAGNWSPTLPVCQDNKRCRAPPRIENATASERITPYITFPHQTVVHYKCNAGFDERGTTSNATCFDGEWTSADVICVATTIATHTTTLTTTTTPRTITSPTKTTTSTTITTPSTTSTPTTTTTPWPTTATTATVTTTHKATMPSKKKEHREITTQNNRCVYDRTRYVFKPNITADGIGRTTEYVNSGTFMYVECIAPKEIPSYDSKCTDSIWDPALPNCDGENQHISNKQETTIIASVVPSLVLLGAVVALAVYCSKLRRKQTENPTDTNYFTTTEVLTDKSNYEVLDKYTVTEQARGTNR